MQRLHVHWRLRRSAAATQTENIATPALELRFPRGDLIGMDVELLRQLNQRSIALDGLSSVETGLSRWLSVLWLRR